MSLSPWKKCRSGGCPKQMRRQLSPEIVHSPNKNEESFQSLNSSVSTIPANHCDEINQYFEEVIFDDHHVEKKEDSATHDDTKQGRRRRSRETPSRRDSSSSSSSGSPLPNSRLGFSEMVDNALTKAVDALLDSMSCGLDATCHNWMNVPGVDREGCKFFTVYEDS